MFDRESLISRINWDLSVLVTYLKLSSGQNLNSPAVLAEDFCVGLLNLLYGYNLSNANTTTANAPAVDLVDNDKRLAVQITINDTTEKIRHTHRKASEYNLGDDYDNLILLFLVSKAPAEPAPSVNFTPCTCPAIVVRDLSTILGDIRALDVARMSAIADLLDAEIRNPDKPWNRDASLRPANLPYASLGPLFKGRDAFLADLHERLTGHAATLIKGHAIHGLGGVGKTRTAIEYAWRYHIHYTALLFVSADTLETLDTKLAALCNADVLSLPEKELTDQSEQKAAVLLWLQTHPGWLLILDNTDSEDVLTAVDQLLPRLTGGHILITSRLTDYAGGVDAVTLDVLSDEDAAAFLVERTANHRTTAPDDDARALELARELGGLALAMEQAAAHIRKVRLSFATYLEIWHHNTAAALHWYNARTMHYPRSLAATYQISVDQLSDPAKEFFRVLSWFDPNPIPFFALEEECLPPSTKALLAELENLSLAQRTEDGTGFIVHRLVQEITRQQQPAPPPSPSLLSAVCWIEHLFPFDSDDVRNWPVAEPIASHAAAIVRHSVAHGILESSARLLNQLALFYKSKAQHATAEPLYRQAIALYQASPDRDNPQVAATLNNLASLLMATSRHAEAEPLIHQAIAIAEAAFGRNHPDVATDLCNLGQLLHNTNRLEEAELPMREALAIHEACYGKFHPAVAADLSNLARLFQDTNRLEDAEPLLRQALAIIEGSLGRNHPQVGTIINNLAQLLQATNRLEDAEPLMLQAVDNLERNFGENHPNVAVGLSNLALLLNATNRVEEAESMLRRSLEILVRFNLHTGHPHSQMTTGVHNYQLLLMGMGDTQAEVEEKINKILAPLYDL